MYPIMSKDEVLEKLEPFLADAGKSQTLVSDEALKLKSRGFSEVYRKRGIWHEFSAPYTHQEKSGVLFLEMPDA